MADLQFNYAELDSMAAELQQGAQRLEDTKNDIAKIAHSFHQGSFEGKAGEAFATGLAQDLSRGIDNLAQFYQQMAEHIRQAAQEMMDMDAKAKF
jgi:WXG100 family type VII secretion target